MLESLIKNLEDCKDIDDIYDPAIFKENIASSQSDLKCLRDILKLVNLVFERKDGLLNEILKACSEQDFFS